ncbi:hypothetical protein ACP70R_033461 [Stipagrostis hirtigluma subsp. patula]
MQVCAQGSVNNKGIFLDDVWFVPRCPVNVVSIPQLRSQGLQLHREDGDTCLVKRSDGTVVGQGIYLYDDDSASRDFLDNAELDFLDISGGAWYIAFDVAEHMTGDMSLLTDFSPMQPGCPAQTRTGVMLVCGKGSVKNTHFAVSDVSYVPGLKENLVSLTMLTCSSFNATFGPGRCIITRSSDGAEVGRASHVGGQQYRFNFLRVSSSSSSREVCVASQP